MSKSPMRRKEGAERSQSNRSFGAAQVVADVGRADIR
jgi:hypothetical protein